MKDFIEMIQMPELRVNGNEKIESCAFGEFFLLKSRVEMNMYI